MKPTLEVIQQLFPVGDFIEYQTDRGFFSGMIIGYKTDQYGTSLDLGDRRFPVWNAEDIEFAKKYHRKVRTKVVIKPTQLTLF